MNGRCTGGSRLWPSGSNEIRWCNAGCPSLPACLERNPPACRPWPDAQPDAVWADSASGTWHSPMAIFPASHQRIRWLSAGGWERKNWRVFGGPPMYAIWVVVKWTLRNKLKWNSNQTASICIYENKFEAKQFCHGLSVFNFVHRKRNPARKVVTVSGMCGPGRPGVPASWMWAPSVGEVVELGTRSAAAIKSTRSPMRYVHRWGLLALF